MHARTHARTRAWLLCALGSERDFLGIIAFLAVGALVSSTVGVCTLLEFQAPGGQNPIPDSFTAETHFSDHILLFGLVFNNTKFGDSQVQAPHSGS